ncbi:hypothetical protein [Acetobacter indonesiensis]|uniref:hypothetical protein n=1 Tax=Acetobacter indonesiensis TaxID=104101 RepID=UPI000A3CFD39|nr:hypothetical protein [Acetobacter indonesiensis]
MKQSDFPKRFSQPIAASASSGNLASIPATQAAAGDGTASVALGFPPETFIGRSAGGVPPRGQDMNGFLNRLSSVLQAYQAGMIGVYDAGFASSIGGYASGSVVAGTTPGTFWVSTADNNMTQPGANGAFWQNLFANYLPLAGGKLSGSLTIGSFYSFNADNGYSTFYRPSRAPSDGILDYYSDVGGTYSNVSRITSDGSFNIYGSGHFYENNQQVATQNWANGQFATPTWVSAQFAQSSWVSSQFERLGNCVPVATYTGDFSTSDSRVINLAYGHRIQFFTVSVGNDTTVGSWVTFPQAFSNTPIVLVGASGNDDSVSDTDYWVYGATTTGVYVRPRNHIGLANLIAIGSK